MSGSAPAGAVWIQAASALVLLVVAGHCVARLVQAGRAAAWTDAARHAPDLLMALGLAAMLWHPGDPVPPLAGEVAFGLAVAWSMIGALGAGEGGRRLSWVQHAVGAATMVYMFGAMSAAPFGPITWALVVFFASFAVWSALVTVRGMASGLELVGPAAGPVRTLPALVLAPPTVSLCHAVMAIAMVYLLLAMR